MDGKKHYEINTLFTNFKLEKYKEIEYSNISNLFHEKIIKIIFLD